MDDHFPKVYIDESGNTGSNICDEDQRYFVLSAVSFHDDDLKKLQKDINYSKELHFSEMKASIAGRKAILNLLSHDLINSEHISYQFVDKKFCIYAQITDMTIEPVFHYIFKTNFYRKKYNIIVANLLYTFLENHSSKDLVNKFKLSFMVMIRSQSERSIKEFYDLVDELKKKSSKKLNEILSLIGESKYILKYVLIDDKKYSLDTTLTSLISLTNHWHNIYKTKLEIITDISKPLAAQEDLINQLINIKNECIVGYDTRKHTYPLPIQRFRMVDSTSSFGVQIADMIASAVTFRYNEPTKKYQKFHQELNELDFSNMTCYPLCPASYEDLIKTVDDSKDIDPLDFLIENIDK